MSDMRCVRWHCLAEVSHLSTDHLFGPLKQHLGCRQFIKIRYRKIFFLSVCQSKSPISTATEFLNLCHEGSVHPRELCQKCDTAVD
jgi:hypothetical protein